MFKNNVNFFACYKELGSKTAKGDSHYREVNEKEREDRVKSIEHKIKKAFEDKIAF